MQAKKKYTADDSDSDSDEEKAPKGDEERDTILGCNANWIPYLYYCVS